jgi:hypothetical protein
MKKSFAEFIVDENGLNKPMKFYDAIKLKQGASASSKMSD